MLLFDHLIKGLKKCVLRHFLANCWKIDIKGVENLQHFDFHFQEPINDECLVLLLNYKTQLQAEKISMVRLGNAQNLLNEISCLPVCVLPIYDQHPPSLIISTQSLS